MNMLKNAIIRSTSLKTMSSAFLANKTDHLYQQTRTTFILKRVHEPRLRKKNQRFGRLTRRTNLYELVEDTESKPPQLINLILTSDVEPYGSAGDIVSVKSETAYNRLILPKLAIYASPEAIEQYRTMQANIPKYSSPNVKQLLKMLSTWNISTLMSSTIPWTLEKWHVKVAFRRCLFHVPEDAITMPDKPISGPNMSLDGKYFFVKVKINDREEVRVKCTLYHLTSELKAMSLDKLWEKNGEPIFEEDRIAVDSDTSTPVSTPMSTPTPTSTSASSPSA